MESIRENAQTHNPHEFVAENIPTELKSQDAWILWHGEYNEKGKLEKKPYQVSGYHAKSSDPATWTAYERAAEVASENNDKFGLGFVFDAEGAFGGVDLDGCRNPETGEIKAWAREIVDSTPTYAEVSPSLTGIKLVGIFKLPPMSGHKKILNEETGEAIEVYDQGRFFTVTGRQIPGTPNEVRNIQIPIEGVLGRYFTKPQRGAAPTFAPRKLRKLTEAERDAAIRAIADHLPESHLNDLALDLSGYLRRRTDRETLEEILIAAWDIHGLIKADGSGLKAIIARAEERLANGENTTGGPSLEARNPEMYKALRAALGEDEKPSSGRGEAKEGNQAQRLIGYAMVDADELFLDQNGTEHVLIAGVPVPLDRGCYGWLRRLFWEHEEVAATTDLLGTVAGQLRAFAEVSGNEHHLYLRAAQHEGAVYLYLGPGRVVRVASGGWTLDPDPLVMFRRVANVKELPTPEQGGSLDLLDAFITAKEDRDHRLAKAWLVLALLADLPRPILLAHGPQGATKSSVQRVLKNIIDPTRPTTLKLREKDFEQNINKAFVPFFDNISNITDHMADELSKAVTGAGNAVRKLYADDEDVIREYKRAILLNGLIIPTEKADLIDRTLPVALKRVPPEQRETERRMQALFEERHAPLLGAVLDALSGTLANHEEVRGLPRLADWAEYAIALYKHLDWGGHEGFMSDWAVIEEGQHETTLEGSVLAQAVVAVVEEHAPEPVQEAPKRMLELVREAADSEGLEYERDKDFPSDASWLWRKLVPVVPTLEAVRISAVSGKGPDKKRFIRFERSNPDGGDSIPDSSDSKENMLSPSDPHTYAPPTAGTAETPYFSRNRKYTTECIDNGEERDVLQGGKNAVSAVPGVGEVYISQPEGDSKTDDAVTEDGNAVPCALPPEYVPEAGDSPKPGAKARAVNALSLKQRSRYERLVGHGHSHSHALREAKKVPAEAAADSPKVEYDPDYPENFRGLAPDDQSRLLAWIRSRFTPHRWLRLKVGFLRDSYNFKALFERSENGFYIDNGTFKGAMLAAGFEPVASDDGYPYGLEELMFDENWSFRGKLKYYFEWLPTVEQQEWALEAIRGWGHPVRVGVAAKQRQIPRAKVGKLTEVLLYLEQEGWARFRNGGWEPTYRVPYPSQRSFRPSGGSLRARRVNND